MHVVVDRLSLPSALYLVAAFFRRGVDTVYYFEIAAGLGPFYLFLLHRLLGCSSERIEFDIASEKNAAGELLIYSIESVIQDAMAAIRRERILKLRLLGERPYAPYPKLWLARCVEHGFLPIVYRFATNQFLAENRIPSGQAGERILCHAYHPLNRLLLEHLPLHGMSYRPYGAWMFPAHLFINLLKTSACYLAFAALAGLRAKRASPPLSTGPGRVGVQYCWGHDALRRSDLYWLNGSGIEPGRVLFYFDRSDRPLTPEVAAALDALGHPFLRRRKAHSDLVPASVARIFGRKQPSRLASGRDWRNTRQFAIDLLAHCRHAWVAFLATFSFQQGLLASYLFNELLFSFIFVLSWKDFFVDNNIRVNINHSGDVGRNHVIQSLAMEASAGINIRTTYSFPPIKDTTYAREFHTFFLWGRMAKCDVDTDMLYCKHLLISGYLFDHLFSRIAIPPPQARFIGQRRTIAVFDESYGGWNNFSKECIVDFYTQVSLLALARDDVGLVIKSKRYGQQEIAAMSSSFGEAAQQGKIFMVEGESPYKACVGAELALCVGINSAGIEAALFGLPVLFLAVDNTVCPLLEHEHLPQYVHHDAKTFIQAVTRYLADEVALERLRLDSAILDAVDPFRDKRAGERIGLFIHDFLAANDAGSDADQALSAAVEAYSRKWGPDKVV